jgi:hypothetical protein
MAGSWRHMTATQGRFLNNENFTGMIGNLGDAYEAAEECYGMVWWLAETIAGPGATRAQILGVIRRAEEHYLDGLRLGGRQRER